MNLCALIEPYLQKLEKLEKLKKDQIAQKLSISLESYKSSESSKSLKSSAHARDEIIQILLLTTIWPEYVTNRLPPNSKTSFLHFLYNLWGLNSVTQEKKSKIAMCGKIET